MTKNRYIASLDLDAVIQQAEDEGEHNNEFVEFLKKTADQASAINAQKESPKTTRKPMYMMKKKKKKTKTKAKAKAKAKKKKVRVR